VFAANSFSHAASLQAALVALGEAGGLSPVGAAATTRSLVDRGVLDEAIRTISWLGMALVYAALTYFTFFHRWKHAGDERAK
jgi:hypothetical protein